MEDASTSAPAQHSVFSRIRRFGTTPEGALFVAFTAWTLASLDHSLFGYAIPGAMKEFEIGLDAIGLIVSASFLFGMVAPVVIGILADSWGPRFLMLACLTISSLLVFAQGVANTMFTFGALRVLSYGISGALSPVTSAMVANTAPVERRALYIAILQAAFPFGWFLASMAVVPMSQDGDWRAPFSVALLVIPIAVFLYAMMPKRFPAPTSATPVDQSPESRVGAAEHPVGSSLSRLFCVENRRTAILCSLAFFFYGGAIGGSAFFLPTFFQEDRGYDSSTASMLTGLTYGIAIIGYVGSAVVSQRLLGARLTTIIWSAMGSFLLLGTLWVPANLALDIFLFGLTAIFFFGTSSILTTYVLAVFPPAIRTTAMAVCGTASLTTGFIIFPMLISTAVERIGWAASFSILIVPACLMTSVVVSMLPNTDAAASE
ncbi:MAG: AAHS family benzoate transporter-like MFS transporter [Halieaceae bacterium]|jgi:AAHS family benzoate transporter-like MFS transporter